MKILSVKQTRSKSNIRITSSADFTREKSWVLTDTQILWARCSQRRCRVPRIQIVHLGERYNFYSLLRRRNLHQETMLQLNSLLVNRKLTQIFFFLYRKALTFKMTQTHSLVSCEIWNLEVLSYFQVSFRTLLAKSDAWTTWEETIPETHPYRRIKLPETEVSLPPGLRPFQT